jgi:Straboviridae/Kyanoviridae head completion nuclease
MIKRKSKDVETFIPRNGSKYRGRYPIVIRSSWERMTCQWLDCNPDVMSWSSEGHIVYYYDPVQMKKRRYYPDFYAEILNKDRVPIKYIIEVKPYRETMPPRKTNRQSKKTKLYQEATWLTNQAKFNAAKQYCKKMGYRFQLLTERELFGK